MRENIFAYTSDGEFSPEYISVKSNSDSGGEITVRSLDGGLASINLEALGRALLACRPLQLDEREKLPAPSVVA